MVTGVRRITGFRFLLIAIFLGLFPSPLMGTEQYAAHTGKDCQFCHEAPWGGPDLTLFGKAFQRGGHRYPIPLEAFQIRSWPRKILSLLMRYFHIVAGLIWFGTIFYVHIFVMPKALALGLPKATRAVGWVCFITVGLTGSFLAIERIKDFSQLWTTQFGVILSIKTILYLLMVGIAVLTTTFIHKRLQRESRKQEVKGLDAHFLTHTDLLSSYSGTGDQPTYIAVGDDVYDVSESSLWSGGMHMGQHLAGRDLTNGLAPAPHGPEVLDTFRKVGKLWRGAGTASLNALWGTFTFKTFLFLARSVLVITSLIILCVALWRSG
jgi:predicted heme/steroid binding protein/uncharacterized membrane protein